MKIWLLIYLEYKKSIDIYYRNTLDCFQKSFGELKYIQRFKEGVFSKAHGKNLQDSCDTEYESGLFY